MLVAECEQPLYNDVSSLPPCSAPEPESYWAGPGLAVDCPNDTKTYGKQGGADESECYGK